MSSKKKKPAVQSPQEKVQPVESKPVEVVEEEAPQGEASQMEAPEVATPQEPLPPVETIPHSGETTENPVPPGMIRFQVSGPIASLSHGQAVYPVTLGRVDLPAGEKWYQDLVKAGELSR